MMLILSNLLWFFLRPGPTPTYNNDNNDNRTGSICVTVPTDKNHAENIHGVGDNDKKIGRMLINDPINTS